MRTEVKFPRLPNLKGKGALFASSAWSARASARLQSTSAEAAKETVDLKRKSMAMAVYERWSCRTPLYNSESYLLNTKNFPRIAWVLSAWPRLRDHSRTIVSVRISPLQLQTPHPRCPANATLFSSGQDCTFWGSRCADPPMEWIFWWMTSLNTERLALENIELGVAGRATRP